MDYSDGISEQYNLAERIASDAASLVKIAHEANLAWVHSGKFGLMVANNRGLAAKNFTSKAAALKWLLGTNGSNQPNNPAYR